MKTSDEYLELITSEHHDKPKYMATVKASLEPIVQLQNLLLNLPKAFDLDEAIGYQLDVVGQWVGISRYVGIPISDFYFTWADEELGWGDGSWQGRYDPAKGMHTLHDDMYRQLIKARIAANQWDGSIENAYNVWRNVFKQHSLLIQDNQDMSMVVGIAGLPLNPIWEALLTGGYIPLKPQGVKVKYYAVSKGGSLFAWDAQEEDVLMGWENGNWPQKILPN